jgi:hypothetical protein
MPPPHRRVGTSSSGTLRLCSRREPARRSYARYRS